MDRARVFRRLRGSGLTGSTGLFVFCLALALVFLVRVPFFGFPALKYIKEYPRPEVRLDYATYKGLTLHHNVNQYLGMRFAAPPLDDLRWRAPRDPPEEMDIQDASEFGPTCLGTNHNSYFGNEDEDCLFVNVWAPKDANETTKLPVWVFIQGGGYTANSNANYNGSEVVKESGGKVVFVNFNYRVGLWGFLADERVREDGDLNVGLLDQRHLLHWVQKHISKFGGDPNHVVIHGVSAGAGAAAMHLTAYGGRDDHLFTGVATEAVFWPAQPRVEDLGWQFNRTLKRVGCEDAESPMACLRSKSKRKLQKRANRGRPFVGRDMPPNFYWTPCVDGDLIQDSPSNMFKSGKFVKVPVMLGTSTNEGTIFAADAATPEEFTSFMRDNFPQLTDEDEKAMLEHYPKQEPRPQHEAWFPSAADAYGEATFICPTNLMLDSLAEAGLSNQTWSYRYNVHDKERDASGVGVEHTFDRMAILGPDNVHAGALSYYTYNAPMVPLMMNYYISFVRKLDPNLLRLDGAPEWGNWKDGERMKFELSASEMETTSEGQRERCRFWNGIAESMEQ